MGGVSTQAGDIWKPIVAEQRRREQTPPEPSEVEEAGLCERLYSQEAVVRRGGSQGRQDDRSTRAPACLVVKGPPPHCLILSNWLEDIASFQWLNSEPGDLDKNETSFCSLPFIHSNK